MRTLLVVSLCLSLASCSSDDGPGLDEAKREALVQFRRSEQQDATVVAARTDDRCAAVELHGTRAPAHANQVVVLVREGASWTFRGLRDDTIDHLDASKANCGFN